MDAVAVHHGDLGGCDDGVLAPGQQARQRWWGEHHVDPDEASQKPRAHDDQLVLHRGREPQVIGAHRRVDHGEQKRVVDPGTNVEREGESHRPRHEDEGGTLNDGRGNDEERQRGELESAQGTGRQARRRRKVPPGPAVLDVGLPAGEDCHEDRLCQGVEQGHGQQEGRPRLGGRVVEGVDRRLAEQVDAAQRHRGDDEQRGHQQHPQAAHLEDLDAHRREETGRRRRPGAVGAARRRSRSRRAGGLGRGGGLGGGGY